MVKDINSNLIKIYFYKSYIIIKMIKPLSIKPILRVIIKLDKI